MIIKKARLVSSNPEINCWALTAENGSVYSYVEKDWFSEKVANLEEKANNFLAEVEEKTHNAILENCIKMF